MHHIDMLLNVVAGLLEVLLQEQGTTENPMVVAAPDNHVANAVQATQQQLATQLQKRQSMMQAMQMQYAVGPHNAHQHYGGCGYHGGHANYCGQVGCGAQRRGNWRGGHSDHVKRDLIYYCWTHVMCAHPIKYLRTP